MRGTELLIRSVLKGAKAESLPSSSSPLKGEKMGKERKKQTKSNQDFQHEADLQPCEEKIHTYWQQKFLVCREYQKKKKEGD